MWPFDLYAATGVQPTQVERASYLGIVTLGLLFLAAMLAPKAVKSRQGFWWAALAMLAVLSLGSFGWIGPKRVELPSGWLWKVFPPFRLLRVPARFNLFVAVVAAGPAAVGLREALARVDRRALRPLLLAGVLALGVLDLSISGFPSAPLPPMPTVYGTILRDHPNASFVEIPSFPSGSNACAVRGYWQSIHGGKTTSGSSAHPNIEFDSQVVYASPFGFPTIVDPLYLQAPRSTIDLADDADFLDVAWLFLTARQLDYAIVHRGGGSSPMVPEVVLDRIRARLSPALVVDDGLASVYSREKIPAPKRPVAMAEDGWRLSWRGRFDRVMRRSAGLVAFVPEGTGPVRVRIEAMALRRDRNIRLMDGPREIARWTVRPGAFSSQESPPLILPAGLVRLRLEADGEDRPSNRIEAATQWDREPYSMHVNTFAIVPEGGAAKLARK